MTVVVSAGVIEWIGISADPKRPAHQDAVEFDGRGKFLIPGLWDMHTHVAGISADPAWSKNVLLPLLVGHHPSHGLPPPTYTTLVTVTLSLPSVTDPLW